MELVFDAIMADALQSSVYYGIAGGLFPVLFFMLVVMFLRMR